MPQKKEHPPKEAGEEPVSPSKITNEDDVPDDLKELLKKSLHWSQIIYEQNKAIKKRLTWMTVSSWLRLLLILVPLIVGLIFLPPLIKQVWGQYASLLGSTSSDESSYDINSIIQEVGVDNVKEFLKILEKK